VSTFNVLRKVTQKTIPAPPGQSGYQTDSYVYDGDGDLVKTIAPPAGNGQPSQVTVDTFDSAGQLASQTTGYGTSAASTISYCYDPAGQQTAVVMPDGNTGGVAQCETSSPWVVSATSYPVQAGYQTTSGYDSAGEKVTSTSPATSADPGGATTTWTYDPAGNERTTTDPAGVTTTYTYTPAGLPSTVSYSGSSAHSVSYSYDADGNLTGMTDASGTTASSYDPFGELTSATNGAGQTTGYSYNPDGAVTSITYPLPASATWATSQEVTYGYDNASRLTSVTDFTGSKIGISDTPDGLLASATLGSSGDAIGIRYGNSDTPSLISLTNSASTLQSFGYADAPSGDVLTETDTPSSATSPASYTYDSQRRVTSMTPGAGPANGYGFDASGNLLGLPDQSAGTYDKASELTSSALSGTTTSYSYDADGQRVRADQGGTTVATGTWNGAAELTGYSGTAATMTGATYDGNGFRQSATFTPAGGSATAEGYVWNAGSKAPQLLMDSANAYIYDGGGTPAEQVSLATGAVTYLVSDALGSVRGAVSGSGSLTATTSYDAWGRPQTSGGLTAVTPFGFAGGYTDPTGLVYLLHRYYDPATGQFLSVDPDVSKTNRPYQYASDNPVDATDPTGLFTVGTCLGYGGMVGTIHLAAGGCLTRTLDPDGRDDIGLTVTGLVGFGEGFGFEDGAYYEVSNSETIQGLGEWFWYVAAGYSYYAGVTGSVFWGGGVVGADIGAAAGFDAFYAVGKSYTWWHIFRSRWVANPARWAWDVSTGGPGVMYDFAQHIVSTARWVAHQVQQALWG
jgi:RHS repeat-associated protein